MKELSHEGLNFIISGGVTEDEARDLIFSEKLAH